LFKSFKPFPCSRHNFTWWAESEPMYPCCYGTGFRACNLKRSYRR